MTTALQTIQAFVAPVVMISANGLVCLAIYQRLACVMNRTRAFNKERFDLSARLSAMTAQQRRTTEGEHLKRRIDGLDMLDDKMIVRVRLLRNSLISLLLSVLFMLGCSVALGLTSLLPWLDSAALALFVCGLAVMMWGVLCAIRELHKAMAPLLLEQEMLEMTSQRQRAVVEYRETA